MHSAGDILKPTADKAPEWAKRAEAPPPHPDYCSCRKAPGEWGNHGMHWREYGEPDIRREVDRAIAALPMDVPREQHGIVERLTRQRYAMYVGLHVAIMQCPPYYAKLKAECDARKAQQARDKRGGMHLGDDL